MKIYLLYYGYMPLALYRKYRPRTLGDLLGQETNVLILKNAAKQGKIGHAYLFYGSRGTGKTTTARLIAKLLNCEKRAADEAFRKLGEPCNECRSCREIDENVSLDVMEIDAASNRGIDEIRNLKDAIRLAPSGGRYKVYIIDEAHMLTGPAFNALLKTLEEPPAHAVFVLATTEYEKLPATITSRTQRFLFKRLPKTLIMQKLSAIVKEESIKIDDAALELIAAAAEGSVRDAESLLEQVSSFETNIDLIAAERLTGRVGLKKIEEIAAWIVRGNLPGVLERLGAVNEEGYHLAQFTSDLIHYLRRVLSLSVDPTLESVFRSDLTDHEIATLKTLAPLMPREKLVTLIKNLIRAYTEIRYSPFALVPLEVALIETLGK